MPLYERLVGEPRLADRVRDILVAGVSTHKYADVLPAMAGTVEISRSSGSRQFIEASARALDELMSQRLEPLDILAIWIDGFKALRSAIEEVFGDRALVQRCRIHKMRNISERLPQELARQVKAVMHAA